MGALRAQTSAACWRAQTSVGHASIAAGGRGQTSAEWVLIVSGVLALGLLLAGMLIFLPSAAASESLEARSRAYWGSEAFPLQVSNWHVNAGNSSPAANLTIVLSNAGAERVRVRKLIVGPGNFSQAYNASGAGLGASTALDLQLLPRDSLVVVLAQGSGAGSQGVPAHYNLNLSIVYDGKFPSMREDGRVPLAGELQEED